MVLRACVELAGHLQSHCHWLLEMAILIVSAIAEGESHVVSPHFLSVQP